MGLKVNPGALAGATGALNIIEAVKLPGQITPEPVPFATVFWFKVSGSSVRLSGYPRGVAV